MVVERTKRYIHVFIRYHRINIRNKDLEKYNFIEELTKDKNKNNKKFGYSIKKFNNESNLDKVNISIDLLRKSILRKYLIFLSFICLKLYVTIAFHLHLQKLYKVLKIKVNDYIIIFNKQ